MSNIIHSLSQKHKKSTYMLCFVCLTYSYIYNDWFTAIMQDNICKPAPQLRIGGCCRISFTACVPLPTATNAAGLGRRC